MRKKLAGVLLALFALLGSCAFGSADKHVTDAELIENFQSHKEQFNQLLQMFLADKGLYRVGPDFTHPEDAQKVGIGREKLIEYRRIFGDLNLPHGVGKTEDEEIVWFNVSAQGLAVTGSSKGYAYAKSPPKLIVDSLETYWSKDGRSFTAFRHIEGNWYLYFDYED